MIGNRVFVAFDCDDLGQTMQEHAMNENISGVSDLSSKVEQGSQIFKQFASQHGGYLVSSGGDSGILAFDGDLNQEDLTPAIEELRQIYSEITGTTVTVGIGRSLSQAAQALLKGKQNGKNQVSIYGQEQPEQDSGGELEQDPEEGLDGFEDDLPEYDDQEYGDVVRSPEENDHYLDQEPNEEIEREANEFENDGEGEEFEEIPEDGEGEEYFDSEDLDEEHPEEGIDDGQEYQQMGPDQEGFEPAEKPYGQDGETYDDDISVGDGLQSSLPQTDGGYDEAEEGHDENGDVGDMDQYQDESTEENPEDTQDYQPENVEDNFENQPEIELEGNTDVEDGMSDVDPLEEEQPQEDVEEEDQQGEVDEDGVPMEFSGVPEDEEEVVEEEVPEEQEADLDETGPQDSDDEAQAFHEMLSDENAELVENMKGQVAQTLDGFKQVKDQLEGIKDQAPELFQATIGMLDTMLELSKLVFGPYSEEGGEEMPQEDEEDGIGEDEPEHIQVGGKPAVSADVKKL